MAIKSKKGDTAKPVPPPRGSTKAEQASAVGITPVNASDFDDRKTVGSTYIEFPDNGQNIVVGIGDFDPQKNYGIALADPVAAGETPTSAAGDYVLHMSDGAALYVPYGNVYEVAPGSKNTLWGLLENLVLLPYLVDGELNRRPAVSVVSSPYPFGPEDEIYLSCDLNGGFLVRLLPAEGVLLTCVLGSSTLVSTAGYITYTHDDDAPWLLISSNGLVGGVLNVTTAYLTYTHDDDAPWLLVSCAGLVGGTLEVTSGFRDYMHDDDAPWISISCALVGGTLTP
jgi:hypothetical protein